jgi:hypothetical protein
MKKIFVSFISLFLVVLFVNQAQAISPTSAITPTASVTSKITPTKAETQTLGKEKLNEQINELKEKIASRVSELKLVEKRGQIGVVSEISANKITLTDLSGKTKFVDVDEITKFSSSSEKNFGISDLTKGTKISVLGIYNKQSKRILARFIEVTVTPTYISGAISEIDNKNNVLTIMMEDEKTVRIDIVATSKILAYDKTDGLAKYGFSKLDVGDRVAVVGFPDKKDKTLITGTRVIDLAALPKNPKVIVKQPSPTEEEAGITPSVGGGKKLTPIKN